MSFQFPFTFRSHFIWLLSFLLLCSIPFWLTDLDLKVADSFFDPVTKNWPASDDGTFWKFIYNYGVIPGLLSVLGGILVIMRSYIIPGKKLSRIKAWCVILALVLGPGLIVNGIFKPNFGRPRPYDLVRYDGEQQYHRLFVPGVDGESFPAGHPSSGFVLTIFFYLAYRKNRKKAWLYLSSAMTLGVLLGIARISQGGHFLSDVLWSFGMTQIVNLIVYFKIMKIPQKEDAVYDEAFVPPSKVKKTGFYTIMIGTSAGFIFAFLAATPFHHHQVITTPFPEKNAILKLDFDLKKENIRFLDTNQPSLTIDYNVLAHALPWTTYKMTAELAKKGEEFIYQLDIQSTGFTPEYRGRINLSVPVGTRLIYDFKTTGFIQDKRSKLVE